MISIGTSFELRQQAFSTSIVLEPEGVPAHVIFLLLAGGPLRAGAATLVAGSRLGGALTGGLGIARADGGPLLGVNPLDGRADPMPDGPLGWVVGLGAKGPVRVGDLVAAPVVLRFRRPRGARPVGPGSTRELAPGPPAHSSGGQLRSPGRWRAAARPGPAPPADTGDRGGVGLQPALAALLVLTQLSLPVMGPVELLSSHCQPTRHLGRLVAAAT
jgi:hypothetical protein